MLRIASDLHLVKLCVGADGPADLASWQDSRADWSGPGAGGLRGVAHITRMWPRRADELLAGGSLYWVMKGAIACRQRILALDEAIGDDGIRRCAIVMERRIVRTVPAPRRAFQGWRYLAPEDAPADVGVFGRDEELPEDMRRALAEIGVV